MKIPHVELFEWLLAGQQGAEYALASSKMKGLSQRKYDKLVGHDPGPELDLGRGAYQGAEEFKNVLARMYGCERDSIVTTSGGTAANFLVFLSILNQGDEFIIEQPGYQPMWLTPEMLGATKVPWQRRYQDKFQLDVDALEGLITDKTKLIVLTNPHNPSGVVADRKQEIRKAAEIAHARGIYMLVDEIFLDGAFIPQTSAYGLPNVIVTGSMTKVYGLGGQRTGWIIAPPEIAAECQYAKAHTTASSSYVGEIMNAYALLKARERLVGRFHRLAKPNFDIISEWMAANTDIVEWVVPSGGIMCFPRYRLELSSKVLCQKLLDEHHILVIPGEYFDLDGHVRLSYACSKGALKLGLGALAKGLRELS